MTFTIKDITEHLTFNPETYVPKKPTPEPEIKLDPEVERIRKTIKYMESRGEAAKGKNVDYGFSQFSGDPKLGDALGAYQITEARLREKGLSFLGKKVTKDEFLASPELQDKFMRSQIPWQKENGMLLDSVFATHRHGWGYMTRQNMINAKTIREQYVREAMAQYNTFMQEEQAELEKQLASKPKQKTPENNNKASLLDSIKNLIKMGSKK